MLVFKLAPLLSENGQMAVAQSTSSIHELRDEERNCDIYDEKSTQI